MRLASIKIQNIPKPLEEIDFNKNQKSIADAAIHLLTQQLKIYQIQSKFEFD